LRAAAAGAGPRTPLPGIRRRGPAVTSSGRQRHGVDTLNLATGSGDELINIPYSDKAG